LAKINSAEDAIDVLDRLSPSDPNPDSRICIENAIATVTQFRSTQAIPELVRYLSFHRNKYPEEDSPAVIRLYVEGNEYPAIVALAHLGPAIRQPLLEAIESIASSNTIVQNAGHAIALSFGNENEKDPGKAIIFLRDAESSANDLTKQRLEQAVAFILKTPQCKRLAAKCNDADHQSTAK